MLDAIQEFPVDSSAKDQGVADMRSGRCACFASLSQRRAQTVAAGGTCTANTKPLMSSSNDVAPLRHADAAVQSETVHCSSAVGGPCRARSIGPCMGRPPLLSRGRRLQDKQGSLSCTPSANFLATKPRIVHNPTPFSCVDVDKMAQRLTYRRRHCYATRSNKTRVVKTPGSLALASVTAD